MAKTKISEYSATSADNTDISNINIAEGCSPANVNNAIRTVMAQLKDQQAGTSGDPFTCSGTLTSSGTLAVTGGLTLDGAAGTSGQALVSAGSSNTPTWSTLGTMASQSANAVAITGGTITGITDLTVADGGTGSSTLSANAVLLGNGTSALQTVAPSTSGNVLTSNGTTWTSAAPSGLGVGQTWQSVTRTSGTTYTNSTGKPIVLLRRFTVTTANYPAYSSISIDSGAAIVFVYVFSSVGNPEPTGNIIIPVGATYVVTDTNASSVISFELR